MIWFCSKSSFITWVLQRTHIRPLNIVFFYDSLHNSSQYFDYFRQQGQQKHKRKRPKKSKSSKQWQMVSCCDALLTIFKRLSRQNYILHGQSASPYQYRPIHLVDQFGLGRCHQFSLYILLYCSRLGSFITRVECPKHDCGSCLVFADNKAIRKIAKFQI